MSIDAGTNPSADNRRLSLPRLEELSTALRTMFINVGFFAALILLVPAVGSQFTRSAVVIEPITVPPALTARGLSPDVVANRLWDGLQDFAQSASAAREAVVAVPDSQLIEFSLPDSGISVDSIFTQIRQFFGTYDTRIGGEFVCATSACEPAGLRLRLRIVGRESSIVDLSEMGAATERDYYHEAAAGIFAVIDPYVAIAAQAETAPVRAATLARRIAAEGGRDAKWAHNLIGDIERRDRNAEAAIRAYEAALAIDPAFQIARAGLARALLDRGDVVAAEAALAEIERQSPRNQLAAPIFADIALDAGDPQAAIEHLLVASAREPLNPHHLTRAGKIALESGDPADAVDHLTEALSIDPAYGAASALLAESQERTGDLAGAEATYRSWLNNDPRSAEANRAYGKLLLGERRFTDAVQRFDKLLELLPGEVNATLLQAEALIGLSRTGEALATLLALAEEVPSDPAVLMLLARCYQLAGQPAAAVDTYRRVLLLNPDEATRAAANDAIRAIDGLQGTPG
jgi:predicted Zn-dependent protease